MKTLVMGIVNVTPDSFYDGGRHFLAEEAIVHGERLIREGVDILDIGGESTRPGAAPVEETEELRRVLPVVEALAPVCRVSIDTMKATVAREAVARGATLINDVSCSLHEVASDMGVGLVMMHMQGSPADMQQNPHYDDVVNEVFEYLGHAAARAHGLGIHEMFVDPGIGFGKTKAHNLSLLRALPRLVSSGIPVLVGSSRKRFIGAISATRGTPELPPDERFEGSLATATWAMACGVAMVRVHDVKATVEASKIVGDRELVTAHYISQEESA